MTHLIPNTIARVTTLFRVCLRGGWYEIGPWQMNILIAYAKCMQSTTNCAVSLIKLHHTSFRRHSTPPSDKRCARATTSNQGTPLTASLRHLQLHPRYTVFEHYGTSF